MLIVEVLLMLIYFVFNEPTNRFLFIKIKTVNHHNLESRTILTHKPAANIRKRIIKAMILDRTPFILIKGLSDLLIVSFSLCVELSTEL